MELEKTLSKKIEPVLDEAMKKYLGMPLSELKSDISDKILSSPLLGIAIEFSLPYKEAKKAFKKAFAERVLQTHHGNVSEVARITGMDRRSIHRLLDKKKTQHIRKTLPKPYYLKQQEVEGIIETVLDQYKSLLREEKIAGLYESVPEMSKDVVEELPDDEMTLKEAEKEFDKRYLQRRLEENNHDIKKTAEKIGIRYETLLRKVKVLTL